MEEIKNQNEQNSIVNHGQTLASWSFDSIPNYNRGRLWYALISLIAGGLIIYSVVTYNFSFALIILLFILIMIISYRSTKKIKISITEDGLEIDDKFITYRDIDRFWLIYQPPMVKKLYFTTKRLLSNSWSIPLESQNPVIIRRILLKYIKEDLEKEDEPVSEQISRLLKL